MNKEGALYAVTQPVNSDGVGPRHPMMSRKEGQMGLRTVPAAPGRGVSFLIVWTLSNPCHSLNCSFLI